MKAHELGSGINVMISIEENELLKKALDNNDFLKREDIDEREHIIANFLVHKDVFKRRIRDDKIVFLVNRPKNLWRNKS